MTAYRIYGPNQEAGFKISTTGGKSEVNNDGSDAYAKAVVPTDASGVPISAGNSATNITTATTTLVKSGAGVFASLNINTGGAASVATVYDSLTGSGTKLGTFSTATQGVLPINLAFSTGLTVVTATGTPADITIAFR